MRWMGLIAFLLAAAAGCRSDDKATVQNADPAPAPMTYDAAAKPTQPPDAGTKDETERMGPIDVPSPTRGDIEVPILILEE